MELCPAFLREGHVGEHVRFSVVENGGELWRLEPDLVGDVRHRALAASALRASWARAVAMKAETTRRPLLPAFAGTFRMKWTRIFGP